MCNITHGANPGIADENGGAEWGTALVRRAAPRVISDCHFAAPLNHVIPVFRSYSAVVFSKVAVGYHPTRGAARARGGCDARGRAAVASQRHGSVGAVRGRWRRCKLCKELSNSLVAPKVLSVSPL
jgi:hypothetical protein